MTTLAADATINPRPWVDHYPAGITWDVRDRHDAGARAGARWSAPSTPSGVALDFLGKETTFGELGNARSTPSPARCRSSSASEARLARRADAAQHAVLRRRLLRACCGPARRWSTATRSTPCTSSATSSRTRAPTSSSPSTSKQLFEKAEALAEAGHVKTVIVCHFPNALPTVKKVLYTHRQAQRPRRRRSARRSPARSSGSTTSSRAATRRRR